MRYVLIVAALVAACGLEVGTDDPAPHCASVLPKSRNTNYDPSTPVKSGDLDDIEDCIIGHKHDELEFPLSGYSFNASVTGATGPGVNAYGSWAGPGSGTAWYVSAGLLLPVGTRITHVQWAYDPHVALGGAKFVTMSLYRVPWDHSLVYPEAGAEVVTVDTFQDLVSAAAITRDRVIDHTTLSGWSYFLQFSATAGVDTANGLFYGARLFADRL